MASLFGSSLPSYSQEQLGVHLGSLQTLAVRLPEHHETEIVSVQEVPDVPTPSPALQAALHELTQSKPPSLSRLAALLDDIVAKSAKAGAAAATVSAAADVDRAAEAEVLSRAVTLLWAHTMQVFVDGALALEDDRTWWNMALASRFGTVVYLIQTLPKRVIRAAKDTLKEGKESAASFHKESWRDVVHALHWPSRKQLFRALRAHSAPSVSQQLAALASPLQLTRSEMSANRSTLTLARDGAALRVGILATQAPQWRREPGIELSAAADDLLGEAGRVYAVLCDVLGVEEGGTKQFDVMAVTSVPAMADSAHHADAAAVASAGAGSRAGADVPRTATANALLDVLNKYLPRAQGAMQGTLVEYGRPSALTRLWFPLLFLPPALYAAVSAIVRNKDWMGEQVKNAKETVKGFFVQWVWEPIEEIAKTMRGGGEGLGVSPETVKADQDSLERMVVSLGRDYYHMTPDQLEVLKKNVGSGDLSLVLKAYEKEMQSPIKNALAGNLVRTLLIQVQKTKVRLRELKRLGDENSFLTPQTDLSLALERLDQLLRSQQLTFAFVGVAPSVLVLWGVWNWVVTSWRGEHRGKARVRRYFTGLRDVERILITAPEDDARLSNRDRGMIIVSVSGLRTWAVGMGSSTRQNFLDDLRMVENPALARVDKLRVVERMWRCWGLDGKKRVV